MPSPNNSSRGGAGVRLIVLHTAEGALTIQSLGNFFASSSSGVSSHTGADDTPNTVGEYVTRDRKAWTASNANPVAVQIELCAFASWDAAEWQRHPTMLANTAAWIAEEAGAFGIPIRRLSAAEAQGNGRGVCQHNDLGSWGGGHWDCGPDFPMDQVLAMALGGPPAPQPEGDDDMTPAYARDLTGRDWLLFVGDDRQMWASVAQINAPPWVIGGAWTSGLDAWTAPNGELCVIGRGTDGKLYQAVIYTDGLKPASGHKPGDKTWIGPAIAAPHHLYPPA